LPNLFKAKEAADDLLKQGIMVKEDILRL